MRLFPRAAPRITALAAAALLTPLVGACTWLASAQADAATTSALPTVNMEATLKAAQIDPRRTDTTTTTGAKASVLLVEQALAAKKLLDSSYVDGYFGTKTVDAYAAYQRSLGYSGLDANGLPGKTSLTTLGTNRFSVTNVVVPGARTDTGGGVILNARTQDMLAEADRLLGRTLTIDQGSYNPGGDPTSAGTHDGGGAVDVSIDNMSTATRTGIVKVLRQIGFAAWLRTPSQGNWPYHIHAVAISDPDLASGAQHQVGDYYLGFNGLANHAADDGPRIPIVTWEEYGRQ